MTAPLTIVLSATLICSTLGCATADIPQAYKGRLFGRTGALAFYAGTKGFNGPVLGPGTYFTGIYDELHVVDCSTVTMRENIYVRFSADCSEKGVESLLTTLSPDANNTIVASRIYQTYVQPAVGEAVREVVSPYRANDINDKREEILGLIRKRFLEIVAKRERNIAIVYEVNLSNLDFPDEMDAANTDRAVQAILKDKAIAERERVQAEIETMRMRHDLAEREGEAVAVRIEKIGEALRHNPEYLQYDMQSKMPDIYRTAGASGNLVITAPSPSVVVSPTRATPAAAKAPATPNQTELVR
jgi:hypothetical protein